MSKGEIKFDIFARDHASKTFSDVGRSTDQLGGKIGRFGKFVGAAAMSGVAALGALGVAGGVMGVKVAAGNEQAQIAFETMLGSAKKAHTFLDQLQKFAAATPFDFPGLQAAASSLISAGINANKVIPIMTTLGDVTSGMGTGAEGVQRATIALQQMSAAGRITGEDLNQLRDAGIPVYDLLAKATGKSKAEVVKLAQAGKLGSKELGQMMKALETGKGLERFSGLMKKQSSSLTGMWSTFKDTLGQGLAKAAEPLIPLLKDGLGGASEFLAKALEKVGKFLAVFFTAVTGKSKLGDFEGGLGKVNDVTIRLVDGVKRLWGWMSEKLWPALEKAWKTILPGVHEAIDTLSGGLEGGSISWKKIGDVITEKVIPVIAQIYRVYLPLLAKQWRLWIEVVKIAWKVGSTFARVWMDVIRVVVGKFLDFVGTFVHGAATAFGWIPGIGPKLKGAAAKFDTFRDRVNAALAQTQSKKEIRVSAPGASKVVQELADLRWQTDHLPRAVTVGVFNKLHGQRAAGGPIRAGLSYLVGERGPEVVTPTRDGFVHPNGSVGGTVININVDGALDPVATARKIKAMLLELKRVNGGRDLGIA